ncbi:hypothetical protein EVAR_44732_1 [Eumeta japonica]|uniref:Uncharacterized protein n=1 Tax=Eumeta variegata TaxID=151549 RepID=A0A4C1XH47_EUMVA|nr:hypothetical protein EVAR_44732_1 [Eumeta japonica]
MYSNKYVRRTRGVGALRVLAHAAVDARFHCTRRATAAPAIFFYRRVSLHKINSYFSICNRSLTARVDIQLISLFFMFTDHAINHDTKLGPALDFDSGPIFDSGSAFAMFT